MRAARCFFSNSFLRLLWWLANMAQLKISIKMAAAATISSTNWKIFTLNFCCKVCVASEMTDSVVEAVELALSAAFWAAAKASLAASL